MTVELSVTDVRGALSRVSGANASGSGEAASLLLGKIFHETFADLVGRDPVRSGLRVIAEGASDPKRRSEELLGHAWQRLLAPRLRRHAASLQGSGQQVLVLWKATQNLTRWLGDIVSELLEQEPRLRGCWEELETLLKAEVPLACELRNPRWSEPVKLVGIADFILRVPRRSSACAIELKLGRSTPVVDLGQAALYHLILARSGENVRPAALALMRFSPELDEVLIEADTLAGAQARIVDLIGSLAGVIRETPRTVEPAPNSAVERPPAGAVERYAELGKRLLRAYREHGIGVELRSEPLVGPRFLRFDVRLTPGMKVEGLRKRTREVQHRLELKAEPMVVGEAGRLFVDVERPDPEPVLFSSILEQLPPIDELRGSARIAIGVEPSGKLRLADLGSAGRSHVLAAGTTGSGKSEWLRMMLASLIAANTPDTLRIVTFDPKLAAFTDLEGSKFLWTRDSYWVHGDGRPASELFEILIEEMERRYQETRRTGSDHLGAHVEKTGKPLARIVCVCDEYFALINQNKDEKKRIEEAVTLLGAKARAAGIHLVLATQQPSRATISGAIQANLPCRVALWLNNTIESNMILGAAGAERLTGSGDLLYKDFGDPARLQAPFLPEAERRRWLRA